MDEDYLKAAIEAAQRTNPRMGMKRSEISFSERTALYRYFDAQGNCSMSASAWIRSGA